MTITICIGSSCHLKGSRTIIQKLEELITERQLNDKIELNGSFCMGECSNGVCVKINDELFSVSPETVNTFFENEVLRRLYGWASLDLERQSARTVINVSVCVK